MQSWKLTILLRNKNYKNKPLQPEKSREECDHGRWNSTLLLLLLLLLMNFLLLCLTSWEEHFEARSASNWFEVDGICRGSVEIIRVSKTRDLFLFCFTSQRLDWCSDSSSTSASEKYICLFTPAANMWPCAAVRRSLFDMVVAVLTGRATGSTIWKRLFTAGRRMIRVGSVRVSWSRPRAGSDDRCGNLYEPTLLPKPTNFLSNLTFVLLLLLLYLFHILNSLKFIFLANIIAFPGKRKRTEDPVFPTAYIYTENIQGIEAKFIVSAWSIHVGI